MSKNIILLSDGTGNSNIKNRGTNVFKLYEAIDFNSHFSDQGVEQIAFYDDGVGTEQLKPLKLLGSAFGWGLAHNVRELYKHLVQTYQPGDKIYLFGFSRGAFTVRTLAAFIAQMGILKIADYPSNDDLDSAILQLYESYRAKNTALFEKIVYDPFVKLFYDTKAPVSVYTESELNLNGNKLIEFIGVWDTVDAVGLPFDGATELWNKFIFRFKFSDHLLHPAINQACHALSIDDERGSFQPLLWQQDDHRIEQVWFPGVHANVGGGYPQQGLSLVALDWMMEKAQAAGLIFVSTDRTLVYDRKNYLDKLYNSRSGLAIYYRYKPRNIATLCSDNNITAAQIHVSAFQRIAEGIYSYAPTNFPTHFDVVDNSGLFKESQNIYDVVYPPTAGSLPFESPLLKATASLIHLRRTVYYIFLAYSVFTLYWLIRDDARDNGLFSAIKMLFAPDSLLEKLLSLFWNNAWLTVGAVLIFACAVYVRMEMSKVFSKFWFPLRTKIKPLI